MADIMPMHAFEPMLLQDDVQAICTRLKAVLDKQRLDAAAVDSWIYPSAHTGFKIPAKAGQEHRDLQELARTPWLSLVVTNVAQAMYVDAVVSDEGPISDLWRVWQDNNMQSHQIANHRAMIAYGHSYGIVMPAYERGKETARMRCLSPKRVACQWVDPATDLYPEYALEALSASTTSANYRLYDSNYTYDIVATGAGIDGYVVTGMTAHGIGVTPVVRFANALDLDGNVTNEVDPFIPAAARINKTSYDRLLAQHFNSWKVRTIAGIDLPENEDDPDAERREMEQQKMRLRQEDILISEDSGTKFGTLDSTLLDTFVTAWHSDVEALAAVSQTPAHALTGQLVNLNAEALAAARSPLTQKVYERQVNAGASYGRMLRLASAVVPELEQYADDPLIRTTWQDMEIRSMSQAVDALGKAATMLKIPVRGLWNRIPGVESSDVQQWQTLADKETDSDPLRAVLTRHSAATADSAGVTVPDPAAAD